MNTPFFALLCLVLANAVTGQVLRMRWGSGLLAGLGRFEFTEPDVMKNN
jgi:hypothetical protein